MVDRKCWNVKFGGKQRDPATICKMLCSGSISGNRRGSSFFANFRDKVLCSLAQTLPGKIVASSQIAFQQFSLRPSIGIPVHPAGALFAPGSEANICILI